MDFKESEHLRDRDGKFTDGNGSYSDGVNERIEWAKENGIELPLSSDGSVDDLKLQEIYDSTKNKNGKNIENGVLIDEHKSHKGRGYPSYLFAGKVSIGAQEGIVAVAVKKTTGNFYKVHRVLTPDGKDLKIEKDID